MRRGSSNSEIMKVVCKMRGWVVISVMVIIPHNCISFHRVCDDSSNYHRILSRIKLWRNLLLSRKIISKGFSTFYASTFMWWCTSRSTARSSCNLVVQSVTFLFLLGLHSVENLKFTLTWKIISWKWLLV